MALSNIRAKNLKTLRLTHQCERSTWQSILELWDGLRLDGILAENMSLSDLRHLSLCFVWSGTEAEDAEGDWSERVRILFPQCVGPYEMDIMSGEYLDVFFQ